MLIKLQRTHNFNIHLQKVNMQNEIVAETINVWLHKTRKEKTCKLNNEQNRKKQIKLVINYAYLHFMTSPYKFYMKLIIKVGIINN